MRVQRVIARAFGPFRDRTLDFAPGMTVVAGPNESGKSSWHAALRLAITGLRRGKGPGTAIERLIAERHRPWDQPDRWEAEARLQLDDGRQVDISQDLGSKVACRAVDVALGRDVSDEILDGTPDASRWLGLDRDSFASTVSVSQAQIMAVAEAADALQEQMQRAAATRGTDATAAEAIARLEQFRRDAVGADTVAAKGPLRTARNRVADADGALAIARRQHAEYMEQAGDVDRAERAADEARRRLAGAEAARARMQAAELTAKAVRAAELSARHPSPPASLASDDELAARIAAAATGWRGRAQIIELDGRSAADIQAEIDELPPMPSGDTEPHTTVMEAHRSVARATQGLELLGEAPAVPPSPGTGQTAAELRHLARRLEQRSLPAEATLQAELARARYTNRRPIAGAALMALLGVVLAATLFIAGQPAGAFILLGISLLAAVAISGRRGSAAEIARAEGALDAYRHAASAAAADRDEALSMARRAGLPADPRALEQLADDRAAAAQLVASHAAWSSRRDALQAALTSALQGLAAALVARGAILPDADPLVAFDAYVVDCRARATQRRAAEHAALLERELAARLAVEASAAAAIQQEADALTALREAARDAGIDPSLDPTALLDGIDAWRAQRADALRGAQQALAEWQHLQNLLDGSSLEDLQAEAVRRRQLAQELATDLDPAAVTLPLDVDPDEYLAGLRRGVQAIDREHDVARGSLETRRGSLPDVAEAEEAAATAHAELERVQRLAATIDASLGLLRAAEERVHRDLAPILAQAVGRWLPVVSRGAYTEASVDPATLRISAKETATGQWRDARLLSEGTREQIYLLLRVAMAEHLVSTGERAPLLLDEVTAQADGPRKRELLDVLHNLSAERQVILFTHDDEVLAWAQAALHEPTDAIVRLQPVVAVAADEPARTASAEHRVPVVID